jgi:oxygen-independent coproporphyrinogen-3 oxidase
MNTASLYIHIPFCQKKCLYCSFAVAVGQQAKVDTYLDCLEREAATYRRPPVTTVYIGGGTPTFMSIEQIRRLFGIIRDHFGYSAAHELTIEANPEDIEPVKARLLRDLGVNRISLGVQSFHDPYLKYLGRCHDSNRAVAAYETLRKTGFDNINVDLMYAFPDQTPAQLEDDVKAVTSLGSEHLSLYTLTVDEHSRFYTQKIQQKDSHEQSDQYVRVVELLERYGFPQYEISNFAKPGKESRHNRNYWLGGNYIGLGVSAHSHQNGERFWNIPRFPDYLSSVQNGLLGREGEERLNPSERLIESLLLGLRMNAGVDVTELEKRYGCRLPEEKKEKIRDFIGEGFLWQKGQCIGAQLKGKMVLDELSARLF